MEKIIGMVGYECEDIGLYLAGILRNLGQRVALIDRTEQEMLLEMLEEPEEKETGVREKETEEILITNRNVSLQEFDRIIYLFGYRLLHPKLYECGRILLVADGIPAHATLLGKRVFREQQKFLVLRNMVPMKHTENYLALLAGCEDAYTEVPYDEKDCRMRGTICFSDYGNVRRLSAGMKKALCQMVKFIFPEGSEIAIRAVVVNRGRR